MEAFLTTDVDPGEDLLEELGGSFNKRRKPLAEGEVRRRGRPPKRKLIDEIAPKEPMPVKASKPDVVMKQSTGVVDIQVNNEPASVEEAATDKKFALINEAADQLEPAQDEEEAEEDSDEERSRGMVLGDDNEQLVKIEVAKSVMLPESDEDPQASE